MSNQENETLSTNDLIALRRSKLESWREECQAFPTDFRRDAFASDLLAQYNDKTKEELEANPVQVRVAGRMMLRRLMGKASFTHIQDMTDRIQLYVRQGDVGADIYEAFKEWDLGDIIGAEGELFKTKTGELSVYVRKIRLLTKPCAHYQINSTGWLTRKPNIVNATWISSPMMKHAKHF